jgi:hypothetical protein
MLREISQTQKNNIHVFFHMWIIDLKKQKEHELERGPF